MRISNYWSYLSLKIERMGVTGDSVESSQRAYLDGLEIDSLGFKRKGLFDSSYEPSPESKLRDLVQDLGKEQWELISDHFITEGEIVRFRFMTFKKLCFSLPDFKGELKKIIGPDSRGKIAAIKMYRGWFGTSLSEAKNCIENIDSFNNSDFPIDSFNDDDFPKEKTHDWISKELQDKYFGW
jgi:hypothetical protein